MSPGELLYTHEVMSLTRVQKLTAVNFWFGNLNAISTLERRCRQAAWRMKQKR
jgi:hypothetical protein